MAEFSTDQRRAEISAILADLEEARAGLKAIGIDADQPEDREALDLVCRIERKAKATEAAA